MNTSVWQRCDLPFPTPPLKQRWESFITIELLNTVVSLCLSEIYGLLAERRKAGRLDSSMLPADCFSIRAIFFPVTSTTKLSII
jgi:hypothetical protein